jgi:hypothetical protein
MPSIDHSPQQNQDGCAGETGSGIVTHAGSRQCCQTADSGVPSGKAAGNTAMDQNDINAITSHLLYKQLQPLDKAILGALGGASSHWQMVAFDRLTAAEQVAIALLTVCELVQMRIELYGLFQSSQQRAKIQVQASGNGWGEHVDEALKKADHDYGQFSLLQYQTKEIKLTLTGETLQQTIDGRWPDVLAFVRGRRNQPPHVVPGWVVVESFSWASIPGAPVSPLHPEPVTPNLASPPAYLVSVTNWDEGAEAIVARMAASRTPDHEMPGFLSVPDLVKLLRIPAQKQEAVEKRLARLRQKNALSTDLYVECQNAGANQPRFLYSLQMVRLHLADLIPTYVSSVERPSDKSNPQLPST